MEESIDINDWPVVFDWGVCKNEMKWYANERVEYKEDYEYADFIMKKFTEWNTTMRGHVVYWSVDDMNPKWFQEGLYAGDKWDEMNERLWNRIESVLSRYAGKIPNWDIFNEAFHGDLYVRYFGDDIWETMIDRAREIDPDMEIAFNDYELVSGEMSVCWIEYMERILDKIDMIGVQGHMKPFVNGHVVNRRLDTISQYNHRVWVTEFDIKSEDSAEKGNDVEDFMRVAFSHPNVDAILIWDWLRVEYSYDTEIRNG